MTIGEVASVPADRCDDYHYVDVGMYDVEQYGSVYIVDADRPAVIETGLGTNVDRIEDAIAAVGIDRTALETIVTTHVHLDHAGGAGYLVARYPNATVHTHRLGVPHLVDPDRLVSGTKRAVGDQWRFYREPKPIPEDRIVAIEDGDVIDLGNRALEVHHAPGHAPHQVVLHDPDARAIVTGDAAGIWVPAADELRPTTPPPDFDLEQCLSDVEMMQALEPAVLLYPHFGPSESADDRLARYATLLPEWVERVADRREALADDEAVLEWFVERTETDSVWGPRKARDEMRVNVTGVLTYLDRLEGD